MESESVLWRRFYSLRAVLGAPKGNDLGVHLASGLGTKEMLTEKGEGEGLLLILDLQNGCHMQGKKT